MLLPTGFKSVFSISAGSIMRLFYIGIGSRALRAVVRGIVTKMPGCNFTGFPTVLLFGEAIVSVPDYKIMMTQYEEQVSGCEAKWQKKIAGYDFKDDIAKNSLYVRFSPGVTDD